MAQAAVGDLVAAAVRDALDDLVGAEPAQVVADLAAGHVLWRFPELGGEVVRRSRLVKPVGRSRGAAGAEEGLDAVVGEAHPGDAGAGGGDDRAVIASIAAAPAAGSWLIFRTSSRRRLAV